MRRFPVGVPLLFGKCPSVIHGKVLVKTVIQLRFTAQSAGDELCHENALLSYTVDPVKVRFVLPIAPACPQIYTFIPRTSMG
jgi:hypothetical protein